MILGWLCRFFWNDGFHNSTVNWGYRQKSLWIANEENSENFPGKRDEFTSQIMKTGALGKEGDFLSVWDMGMDQYLWIPFLGGWTSIYQLFWCELQGYKVLTHCHILIPFLMAIKKSTDPRFPYLNWSVDVHCLSKSAVQNRVSNSLDLNCFHVFSTYYQVANTIPPSSQRVMTQHWQLSDVIVVRLTPVIESSIRSSGLLQTFELNWLVVSTPLKIWKSVGVIVPNIWKNIKCSKPPTSKL